MSKIYLVHRDSPRCMDERVVGWWSYPVPEFEWEHSPQNKGFVIDRSQVDADYIFYEDGKLHGSFVGNGPKIVYQVVDSTLSDEHYKVRYKEADNADLVLVDWDDLSRFPGKVKRWSYCVNDKLFRPQGEKTVDIGSYHGKTPQREAVNDYLATWAAYHGLTFDCGFIKGKEAYSKKLANCKVAININRNPETRGHRIFDVMASKTCLITNKTRDVSGEYREAGKHYLEAHSFDELECCLWYAMENWETIAESGYQLVKEYHTWSVRAKQLERLLECI